MNYIIAKQTKNGKFRYNHYHYPDTESHPFRFQAWNDSGKFACWGICNDVSGNYLLKELEQHGLEVSRLRMYFRSTGKVLFDVRSR